MYKTIMRLNNMKKIIYHSFQLLHSCLTGCAPVFGFTGSWRSSIASGGNLFNHPSLQQVNYGVKKQTGKTPTWNML